MESKILSFLKVLQSVKPLTVPSLSGPLSPQDASYQALKASGKESMETALYTVSGFTKEMRKRDFEAEFNMLYQVCKVRQHNERMNR
jgi:predicted aconitase